MVLNLFTKITNLNFSILISRELECVKLVKGKSLCRTPEVASIKAIGIFNI